MILSFLFNPFRVGVDISFPPPVSPMVIHIKALAPPL